MAAGAEPASMSKSASSARRPTKDDFDILAHLGEGSVGSVHKVRHKRSLKLYALKQIDKARVIEHNLSGQLLNEIRTQMTLVHPNLLRCLEYFENDDGVFLVLEFITGGDLYRHLKKKGPFSEPDAAHVFAQIAEGLKHLHDNGVIHRDLKPENVLLDSGLVVKIADFGWCAMAGRRTTFCGTLCIMSPEMVIGDAYDARVDIWALGVILFEILAGTSPFDRGQGLMETCKNILHAGLEDAQLERVPPEAHSLVLGLLAKSPEQRTTLAAALAHSWVAAQRAAHAAEAARREAAAGAAGLAREPAGAGAKGVVEEPCGQPREVVQDGPKDVVEDVPPAAGAASWDIPSTSELLVEKLRPAASRGPAAAAASAAPPAGPRGHQQPGDAPTALGSALRRPPDERDAGRAPRFAPVPEEAACTGDARSASPGAGGEGFLLQGGAAASAKARAAAARRPPEGGAAGAARAGGGRRLPAVEGEDEDTPLREDTLSGSRADWKPFIPKTRQRLKPLDQDDESFDDFVPMGKTASSPPACAAPRAPAPQQQDWLSLSSTWSGRVADLLPPTCADMSGTGRVADLLPPTGADASAARLPVRQPAPAQASRQPSPRPPRARGPPRALGPPGGLGGAAEGLAGGAAARPAAAGGLRQRPAPAAAEEGGGGFAGPAPAPEARGRPPEAGASPPRVGGPLMGQDWLGDTLRQMGAAVTDPLSRSAHAQEAAHGQTVEQIMECGFTRQQAMEALKRTSSVEAAVEWICNNAA